MKKCIYIKWLDASYQNDAYYTDEFNEECIVESVGLIAKETKTHISIALEYYETYSNDDRKEWRHILHIPKKYILKSKRFSI